MKIMIVVTHLLGSGHLTRALTLGLAFEQNGHRVTLVSGGMPVPHLDVSGVTFVQLPALRSDGVNFTRLLDDQGGKATTAMFDNRKHMLSDTVAEIAPDVVITELFPFGRRILSAEFLHLLETAHAIHPRPLICASIRDILAPPSKPAKAQATEDIVSRFYDAILVHSDPDITPLQASWPVTPALAERLRYTGFVAPPPPEASIDKAGTDEIIVSAGGGNVGAPLFIAALKAANQTPDLSWRILVGGQDAVARIAEWQGICPPNAVMEPARQDFRQMLTRAAVSVSLCGYNTALDILQAGTPAVFVPFEDGKEVEQRLRATALSTLPGITVLDTDTLTPESLVRAIRNVMSDDARLFHADRFNGARQSVRIVAQQFEERR